MAKASGAARPAAFVTGEEVLRQWGCAVLRARADSARLCPVSGDASFRRYFRLATPDRQVILCDAPPAQEKNREFVAIAGALEAAGVRVPGVLAADFERGWLCLEDLGDQQLLPLLDASTVDRFYSRALAMQRRIARVDTAQLDLPLYDRAELQREMNLFPQWFCAQLLQIPDAEGLANVFEPLSRALCDSALAQPRVFVHRDFHARNLMVLEDGELAAIDFQDAILGPATYDCVSLLRDCYLRWPDGRVRQWALAQRDALLAEGVQVAKDDGQFLRDFDWMGLQRHIKVLGIFSRLCIRDGKDAYLGDLPRVIGYVRDVLALYPDAPALAGFLRWFDAQALPRARAATWYRAA